MTEFNSMSLRGVPIFNFAAISKSNIKYCQNIFLENLILPRKKDLTTNFPALCFAKA